MSKFKKLGLVHEQRIEQEIKLMLHASRDCLRNQQQDTLSIRFDVRDVYYGEAFGIMRALHCLGYGTYDGPSNIPDKEHARWNLKWWFSQLEQEVIDEEHWNGDHHCDHCFERYGKDDARKR